MLQRELEVKERGVGGGAPERNGSLSTGGGGNGTGRKWEKTADDNTVSPAKTVHIRRLPVRCSTSCPALCIVHSWRNY